MGNHLSFQNPLEKFKNSNHSLSYGKKRDDASRHFESGLYDGLIPNPGAQIKNKCQIHVQYDHTKILSHYLPYFESKNMCDPTLTPLIMTLSTYDIIETP